MKRQGCKGLKKNPLLSREAVKRSIKYNYHFFRLHLGLLIYYSKFIERITEHTLLNISGRRIFSSNGNLKICNWENRFRIRWMKPSPAMKDDFYIGLKKYTSDRKNATACGPPKPLLNKQLNIECISLSQTTMIHKNTLTCQFLVSLQREKLSL